MLLSKQVGDYQIKARLGGGRYGVCYLAADALGNFVVLKRFRPGMLRKNREKNHYEAVILSGLKHPAVPELLGVLNMPAGYFFVIEYKPGMTLEKLLFSQKKIFSRQDVLRIGNGLLEVMEYLHEKNVVHRDISIANVLDDGKTVSLIDFGLARYADKGGISKNLDYSCFGEVLLYLLYSSYHGKGKGAWYDELTLTEEQKKYLKRLMGLGIPFEDTRQVHIEFLQCFGG
ncbi:MAG: serine/threonine protein kinase [Massiliimalia sp.]|jgi:serine/threonine protein kinase